MPTLRSDTGREHVRPDRFHALALSLEDAVFDVKWRDKHVYSVDGRMFASVDRPDAADPGYRFKASEMGYLLLIEAGLARPAPYLARAGWVQLLGPDVLGEADLAAYVAQAHDLVRRRAGGRAGPARVASDQGT